MSTEAAVPSTSTVTPVTPGTTVLPPVEPSQIHLDEGIRYLALKKYAEACESLSHATELLTEKYGDLAPEAGDALMLYGKALLMNAIAQSGVLGGAPGSKEGEEHNAEAGPSTAPASSAAFHFGGDAEDEEDEEEEEGDDDEEEGDEQGGGDREDDLETAFLMLDTARAIWEKVETEDGKAKLAEAHRMLGDVASESEQFEEAVTEYTASLNILTAILPPYNRSLSEIHMLIALALDFVPDAIDRAVSHAEQARDILLLKIEQLRRIEKRSDKDEREIVDITELMGDVEMKIEEIKTIAVAAPQTEKEKLLEDFIQSRASATDGAASGIVNNLNSLVRKKKVVVPVVEKIEEEVGKGKRKAGESVESDQGEKKVKVDV